MLHSSKCQKPSLTLFSFPPQYLKVARKVPVRPTRIHYTRAYKKKRMLSAEQENVQLREELRSFKSELEKMTIMMETMMEEREQRALLSESIPAAVVTAAPEGSPQPIPTAAATVSFTQPLAPEFSSGNVANGYSSAFRPFGQQGFVPTPQYPMPQGHLWGMPLPTNEGFRPNTTEVPFTYGQHASPLFQMSQPIPQVTTTQAGPVVHFEPRPEEQIYHSDSVVGDDGMENLRGKFDELQLEMKEMKALRGKEILGPEAHELCLVPDVVIPPKFKMPEFEKYKGDTCPRSHLTMYVRKMSAHSGDDKLLIYCFLDSLAGPASRWYMKLERSKIRTFNDLGGAFLQQYDYNGFLIPDREQLRAESQGDKESFRTYALKWRELASQVVPQVIDPELTRIFLKTLNPFYYKNMVATAPNNFNEMVIMGMRLEEGVREGRLTIESGSSGNSAGSSSTGNKKFGNGYPKKSTPEVGMVAHGGPQPVYPNHPYIANLTPQMSAPPNPNYQSQRPQTPPPYYPPLYQPPYYPQQQYPQQQFSQQ